MSLTLSKLQQLVAPSIGTVILSVIGWQSGGLVAQSLDQGGTAELSNRQVEDWLLAGQRPVRTPDSLAYDQLFSRQETQVQQPVVVPKTPLKMVLSAVFVAPDNRDSGAIIATLNSTARYYKVGDLVEGSIRLSSVHEDHVLLDRNGSPEALYFKDKAGTLSKGLSRSTSVTSAPRREARPAQPRINMPVQTLPPAVQSLPDTELGTDIRRLNPTAFFNKYQQKLQENPTELLNQAGLTPASGGAGYRIGNSPYAGLLTSAGLEMGDVILSVNGNSLGQPQNDAQLLGQLSQQSEVEVVIQRGGRQFAVTFPISR